MPDTALDTSPFSRGLVKREASLLRRVVGSLGEDRKYILAGTSAVVLARDWSEGHARVYACWVAGATTGVVDVKGKHPVTVKTHVTQVFNCSPLRLLIPNIGSVGVS